MADTTLIAVEQVGYCIFGVGDTIAAAVQDANQWLDHESKVSVAGLAFNYEPVDGDMRLVRITPALAEQIRREGGAVHYGSRRDKTVCTTDEMEIDAEGG